MGSLKSKTSSRRKTVPELHPWYAIRRRRLFAEINAAGSGGDAPARYSSLARYRKGSGSAVERGLKPLQNAITGVPALPNVKNYYTTPRYYHILYTFVN